MELVKVEVEVPKEMLDVKNFLVGLVKDIKAKKSIVEISAGSLPALMTAFDGFDKLSEEAKAAQSYDLYALLAADIAKALKG